MFVIRITGQVGECFVDKAGEPTFDIKNAMQFVTRQGAADYIVSEWKEWENVKEGLDVMTVKEI